MALPGEDAELAVELGENEGELADLRQTGADETMNVGSNSMPTETKKSTAKASRSGSASAAA